MLKAGVSKGGRVYRKIETVSKSAVTMMFNVSGREGTQYKEKEM